MPYGDTVRKHRSIIQPFVGSSETVDYMEIQLRETRAMLKYIMDDPDDYGSYVGGYDVAEEISPLAFGLSLLYLGYLVQLS